MSTISKDIADAIVAGRGHYGGDPVVYAVFSYRNDIFDSDCFGVAYTAADFARYATRFALRILWGRDGALDLTGTFRVKPAAATFKPEDGDYAALLKDADGRSYSCEASGIGLPAGLWPEVIEADGHAFHRGRPLIGASGDKFNGFGYASPSGAKLIVFND